MVTEHGYSCPNCKRVLRDSADVGGLSINDAGCRGSCLWWGVHKCWNIDISIVHASSIAIIFRHINWRGLTFLRSILSAEYTTPAVTLQQLLCMILLRKDAGVTPSATENRGKMPFISNSEVWDLCVIIERQCVEIPQVIWQLDWGGKDLVDVYDLHGNYDEPYTINAQTTIAEFLDLVKERYTPYSMRVANDKNIYEYTQFEEFYGSTAAIAFNSAARLICIETVFCVTQYGKVLTYQSEQDLLVNVLAVSLEDSINSDASRRYKWVKDNWTGIYVRQRNGVLI